MTVGPDPSERAMPGGQFEPSAAPNPHEMPTTPLEVAPSPMSAPPAPTLAPAPLGTSAATAVQQPSMVAASGDQCPSCRAQMAADQRYCLECGRRRGDPRLPFMDAVVFMDAVKRPRNAAPPPPPRERRSRMSPNASLIAGVGTLVLAIGVGVLIGHSGNQGSAPVANTAPQVIQVESGGGSETASTANSTGSSKGSGSGKTKKSAKAKTGTDSSGTSKAAAEVLKPAGDVKLPPPTVQPGGKCESGASGCENGEFNGNFFGE